MSPCQEVRSGSFPVPARRRPSRSPGAAASWRCPRTAPTTAGGPSGWPSRSFRPRRRRRPRTAVQRVATASNVPTLIVSGTFDAKTGASWGPYTGRTLPRSTAVRIPGIGHFVVPQSPCAQSVLASFLARPTAPDTGCVAGLAPKPFTITP
nr:alpha/beta hydrolase [Streptomyces sp. TLI_235]